MRAVIRPGSAKGTIQAPPSKSMAHRLLLAAGLARGESVIGSVAYSEDILATLDCLAALGAAIDREGDRVHVRGCDPASAPAALLPCRESGTTLRFMIPLCLLSGHEMHLTGSAGLMRRPLGVYEDICRERHLRFEKTGNGVSVQGKLTGGAYTLPGSVSSQFVSGMLFALPLLPAESSLALIPPVESRAYIDMTLHTLARFGVPVRREENLFRIPGHAVYAPQALDVEGDWSNAAFFLALNCLGGDVRVNGLSADSLQGDRICAELFRRLASGPAEADVSGCPDLAPVLMAVAACCRGARFTGTRRLRFKESDRGNAMARELAKFGARVRVEENRIDIIPSPLHAPEEPLSSHGDHRVAMALSVICTHLGGVIEGAQDVRKSMPDYWEKLAALHINVTLEG